MGARPKLQPEWPKQAQFATCGGGLSPVAKVASSWGRTVDGHPGTYDRHPQGGVLTMCAAAWGVVSIKENPSSHGV